MGSSLAFSTATPTGSAHASLTSLILFCRSLLNYILLAAKSTAGSPLHPPFPKPACPHLRSVSSIGQIIIFLVPYQTRACFLGAFGWLRSKRHRKSSAESRLKQEERSGGIEAFNAKRGNVRNVECSQTQSTPNSVTLLRPTYTKSATIWHVPEQLQQKQQSEQSIAQLLAGCGIWRSDQMSRCP